MLTLSGTPDFTQSLYINDILLILSVLGLHRPPKVFGHSCLPVVILHVQCFEVHISSLYGPIILIFSSIGQQYIENTYRRFSENRIYFNTRNIEIEIS